jgi:hypothetical protein
MTYNLNEPGFNWNSRLSLSIQKCLENLPSAFSNLSVLEMNFYFDELYFKICKLKYEKHFNIEIIEDLIIEIVDSIGFNLSGSKLKPNSLLIQKHCKRLAGFIKDIIKYFNICCNPKLYLFFIKLPKDLILNLGRKNINEILGLLHPQSQRSVDNITDLFDRININNHEDPIDILDIITQMNIMNMNNELHISEKLRKELNYIQSHGMKRYVPKSTPFRYRTKIKVSPGYKRPNF